MKFNISKEELNTLYSKAEAGYYKCINKKENKFLEEEMRMPFSSVRVERSEVKVIFFREETDSYKLETKLSILGDFAKPIGKYWYVIDDKGNFVDDGLVVY